MKFKTNIIAGVALSGVLALGMSLVACDNDHTPDWNETAPFDVNFVHKDYRTHLLRSCRREPDRRHNAQR